MTINELRSKRAKLWEGTKAFLETHRRENGTLSAEDTLKDEKLTAEIPAYAFSGKAVQQKLVNKITAKAKPKSPAQPEPTAKHTPPAKPEISTGRSVNELMERLNLLKY